MGMTFFIDESGNSGDLVNSGSAYDFDGQPYFVLAAIGVEEEAGLAQAVNDLCSRHRVRVGELKSKSKVLQNRPEFFGDLTRHICEGNYPFFIEVVDKRYFLYTQIVTYVLMSPYLQIVEDEQTLRLRCLTADFLYYECKNDVLDAFITACRTPTKEAVATVFTKLMTFALNAAEDFPIRSYGQGVQRMVAEGVQLLTDMLQVDSQSYLRFLPAGDRSKRDRNVWILPNLTSTTNIYARINLWCHGNMENIRLIHDEQVHFDQIILNGKSRVEAFTENIFGLPTPNANYIFQTNAPLEFSASHDSIGIQVADVVAGSVMRFYRDRKLGEAIDYRFEAAVQLLLNKADPESGVGVNQVVPWSDTI